MKKLLAIGIVFLFIGVAVTPNITSTAVTASNENKLVKVTEATKRTHFLNQSPAALPFITFNSWVKIAYDEEYVNHTWFMPNHAYMIPATIGYRVDVPSWLLHSHVSFIQLLKNWFLFRSFIAPNMIINISTEDVPSWAEIYPSTPTFLEPVSNEWEMSSFVLVVNIHNDAPSGPFTFRLSAEALPHHRINGYVIEKNIPIMVVSSGSIQGLIDNASDGDTIYIPSGTYYEHIIVNKSISLIGEDKNTTIIDGGYNTVISIVSDKVNISGFTIQRSSWIESGILIFSSLCTVSDNIISGNWYGISLKDSSHRNTIVNNIFTDNEVGVYLYHSSDQNNIVHNTIMNNDQALYLLGHNNTISSNIIKNNSESLEDSIHLSGSNSNTISDNTITNDVISLSQSDHNSIINNTLTNEDNTEYGLYLQDSSSSNVISQNSFSNTCVGMAYDNACENTMTNNTVNGKPLVYVYDESDLTLDVDAGQILLVNCDRITVQSQEIFNITTGIIILGSNGCIISGNTLTDNYHGIWLSGQGNTVVDNFIVHNQRGITVYDHSDSNNILNNNISNNYRGVECSRCNNHSIISGNMFMNNVESVDLLWSSDRNTIVNNTFTNNSWGASVYYSNYNNVTNNIFLNNQGGIYVIGHRNNISNNTITNNHPYSIDLTGGANNNTVSDNTITRGWDGVTINEFCTTNIISGNMIKNNFHGIGLYLLNSNNTIINNTILNNSVGINLGSGGGNNHNNITNNIIRYNECGAWLYDASYNNIFTNAISNNNDGIRVNYSHHNNIFNNTLRNNSVHGICLKGPAVQNNNIYLNNLIDNGQNAYDDDVNTWYHTVLHEGNYWSDYTGEDTNGDGIGDTPYDIPGGSNQELSPVMEPIS